MATESQTFKASLTGTPKRNRGVDTIPTCTSTDKVARWRLEAAQENLSDPEGNRAKPDVADAGATETGLVAATAPRKLLTVHRRLMLDTKRLIKSLESCETKREFDFESRKFNLLKSEYENFRYSASELKDVELNQLSSEIADKFKKCVNLFETVKDKFCDKTNPLNESENDCDDDMGPADSVSLIAASSMRVTSSKSSIVKQIELERRRSELQVLEDLARSRKTKLEAQAKAAEAKAKAEAEAAAAVAAAEEEETLAKLRMEAIELEAEEKRIACGSEAGSVVSGRSRRSVRSTSSAVSVKSSLIKNAEFKRSAEPTHGTEAGSKPEVGAMLLEHKASKLRLRPLVTEPRPRSNEPQPMQFEQKRNSVTNVTNSINEKFNAMFTNDKSTVLNPQARGFIPQHVSGSRNHNSAAYHNHDAENSENVQRCVSRRVLDAENQHTVLRTAEHGNSGNSNAGPDPCPQFRVNAATWPNVDNPVASESNPNAALSAYLERQGRNEYINLASQVGYDGANIAFVFFENQVRRLMNESPYDERKLEVLRAACVGQPREMVNLFCAPMKSMTTAQRIEKALDRLRQRYGVSSGLTSEPRVIAIRHGAKVNFTATSLKMYNEDLNTLEVFAYAHDEYNKLSGQLLLDTANRLPSALKRRYLDFLDKNGISLNQPSFESLRKFVGHEINVTTSDYAQAFFKSEDKEKSREPQSGRSEFRVHQVALDSGAGAPARGGRGGQVPPPGN